MYQANLCLPLCLPLCLSTYLLSTPRSLPLSLPLCPPLYLYLSLPLCLPLCLYLSVSTSVSTLLPLCLPVSSLPLQTLNTEPYIGQGLDWRLDTAWEDSVNHTHREGVRRFRRWNPPPGAADLALADTISCHSDVKVKQLSVRILLKVQSV